MARRTSCLQSPAGVVPRRRGGARARAGAAGLEVGRGKVVLVLPDGVARTALVEVSGGVAARELARYRVTPGLPYPPEEALVDVLPLDDGRVVAAAVRRSLVEGYEAA